MAKRNARRVPVAGITDVDSGIVYVARFSWGRVRAPIICVSKHMKSTVPWLRPFTNLSIYTAYVVKVTVAKETLAMNFVSVHFYVSPLTEHNILYCSSYISYYFKAMVLHLEHPLHNFTISSASNVSALAHLIFNSFHVANTYFFLVSFPSGMFLGRSHIVCIFVRRSNGKNTECVPFAILCCHDDIGYLLQKGIILFYSAFVDSHSFRFPLATTKCDRKMCICIWHNFNIITA